MKKNAYHKGRPVYIVDGARSPFFKSQKYWPI